MTASILAHSPRYFRSIPSRGIAEDAVDRTGGVNGAGVIHGAAIITRGEALGHRLWVDREMLAQVAAAINATAGGVKARFTHPGLSADGLGSHLGRVRSARVDGDLVRGDLHFTRSAHDTPDGDLAGYVMDLAEQDPEAFGVSIVFDPDVGAQDRFNADHEDVDGEFRSPDPDNAENYPHARVANLRAADVVDEPAANPSGLFHRGQAIATEADALLAYATGLSSDRPTVTQFDVDPDRALGFVSRFLEAHGLEITRKQDPATMPKTTQAAAGQAGTVAQSDTTEPAAVAAQAEPAAATEPTPAEPVAEPEATPAEPVAEPEATPAEPVAQSAADPRAECRRFVEAFGAERGGQWFADGLTFEAAQARQVVELREEVEQLRRRLGSINRGEATPAKFSDGERNGSPTPEATASNGLPPGLARFAAGAKLATANN